LKKTWLADSALGLTVTLAIAGLAYFKAPLTESLENKLYDLRLKHSPKAPLSDQIVFVAIDEASIESVGRWPWPRGHVGLLIQKIAEGRPKVIGVNILYVDPDQNQGLEAVKQLKEQYEGMLAEQKTALGPVFTRVNKDPKYKRTPLSLEAFRNMVDSFSEAEGALDNDTQLSQALAETKDVVLPLFFSLDKPLAEEDNEKISRMESFALAKVLAADGAVVQEGYDPLLPLPAFSHSTAGLGHSNIYKDGDGTVRRETLFVRYKNRYFPSMTLEMARVSLGLKPSDIQIRLGRDLRLGDRTVPLDEENRLLINYMAPFASLKTVSAIEVLADKVPAEAFKGKIVLLGTRATGLGTLFVSPIEANFPDNGVLVTVLQNLLGGRFLQRPMWAFQFEMGSLLFIGLFVALVLPRMKAKSGAAVSGVLLLISVGAGAYLFIKMGLWVKIFYSAALVVFAYAFITMRRFFFTERRKELVEAESIETNKMLGLSFQGQGQLDLAFEKFRKCPIDEAMKELLYNLALDFERKRQFAKAAVVYEQIAKVDAGYKDIKERQKNTKAAGEGMMMGGPIGGGKKDGTVVIEGSSVKPTLGRYEIQKELGRGAMGIVYLGKDPKINRSVAIKTVRFDDDVDEATAKSVKERFFREAESAGTLNHPNIIRIFDAGEDNDISYIAMELLDGEDLKKYAEKANILPPAQVVEYVALVADALDYAHANGVVHRDIKPANIMRLKDGTLRVTDFGIARITASSKTQTGTVMGTPSYMSPEQIAGKKVDGRADLFSLGVMLYEMMTGEKPFDGESIATLLFRISSEPHPDPVLKASERVTPALRAVIDKALQKNPDNRYQKGGDMARDLREAVKNPQGIPSGAVISGAAPAMAAPSPGPAPVASPPTPAVERTAPDLSDLRKTLEATMPLVPPPAAPSGAAATDGTLRLPAAEDQTQKQPPQNTDATLRLPPAANDSPS